MYKILSHRHHSNGRLLGNVKERILNGQAASFKRIQLCQEILLLKQANGARLAQKLGGYRVPLSGPFHLCLKPTLACLKSRNSRPKEKIRWQANV